MESWGKAEAEKGAYKAKKSEACLKSRRAKVKLVGVLKKKDSVILNLRDEVLSWKAASAAETGLSLACCNRTKDRGSPYEAHFEDHAGL